MKCQTKASKKVNITIPTPVKKLTIPVSDSESSSSQSSTNEIPPAQTLIEMKPIPETQDVLAELGLEEENDPITLSIQKATDLQSEVGSMDMISILELFELM